MPLEQKIFFYSPIYQKLLHTICNDIFNFCLLSQSFLIFQKVVSGTGAFFSQLLCSQCWYYISVWRVCDVTCGGKQSLAFLKANPEDFTCSMQSTAYGIKYNLKNTEKQIFSQKVMTAVVLKDTTCAPVVLCCRRTVQLAASFLRTLRFLHQLNCKRSWIIWQIMLHCK